MKTEIKQEQKGKKSDWYSNKWTEKKNAKSYTQRINNIWKVNQDKNDIGYTKSCNTQSVWKTNHNKNDIGYLKTYNTKSKVNKVITKNGGRI